MLKKKLMELLWRLQASQTVIGMVFYPLTLTGVFYPYLRERTDNFGLGQGAVLGGMIILFLLMFFAIIIVGLIFDKLRFWKEQNIVAIERNPYMSYKLTAKEVFWLKVWMLSARASPNLTPELKAELENYERWIDFNMKEDKVLCREVEHLKQNVFCAAPTKEKPV